MQELQLIQELKKHNPFVQKRVYDSFVKRMFRLCIRYVKTEADAQELLMNGFLKFFNAVASIEYRGENTIEPYLKKLMINECLMFIRQRKMNWILMEEINEEEAVSDFSAYQHFDEEAIYQLILKLPDGYRTVFNLYAIEGFSHKEIAAQLRISENTSKTQLYKARMILQTELTRLGYSYGT
jgi:RNA polymerase sigma-70 factor (ECF subfamily)